MTTKKNFTSYFLKIKSPLFLECIPRQMEWEADAFAKAAVTRSGVVIGIWKHSTVVTCSLLVWGCGLILIDCSYFWCFCFDQWTFYLLLRKRKFFFSWSESSRQDFVVLEFLQISEVFSFVLTSSGGLRLLHSFLEELIMKSRTCGIHALKRSWGPSNFNGFQAHR